MDIKTIVNNKWVKRSKTLVKNKWVKRSLIAVGVIIVVKKMVDSRVDEAEERFERRPPKWLRDELSFRAERGIDYYGR